MASDTLRGITFGFELEMVVPYARTGPLPFKDPHPETEPGVIKIPAFESPDAAIFEKLKSSLESIGEECEVQRAHSKSNYNVWNLATDNTVVEDRHTEFGQYSGWQSVELISPVMRWEDRDACASRIAKVLARIAKESRIRLNSTCGLHCHVSFEAGGWRSEDGVSFLSAKKMATVLWMAEGRLAKLYHPMRLAPDMSRRALTTDTYIAKHKAERPPFDGLARDTRDLWLDEAKIAGASSSTALRTIAKLWDEGSTEGILQCFKTDRSEKTAYRFHLARGGVGTVEFRQMEANVDPDLIVAYAELAVRLTGFARAADNPGEFHALLSGLVRDEDAFDVWDLLAAVGCPQSTIEFFRAKRDRCAAEFDGVARALGGREKERFSDEGDNVVPVPYRISHGRTAEDDPAFFENYRLPSALLREMN